MLLRVDVFRLDILNVDVNISLNQYKSGGLSFLPLHSDSMHGNINSD